MSIQGYSSSPSFGDLPKIKDLPKENQVKAFRDKYQTPGGNRSPGGEGYAVRNRHSYSNPLERPTPSGAVAPQAEALHIGGRYGELNVMRELHNVTPKMSQERPALGKAASGTSPAATGILSAAMAKVEAKEPGAVKTFCLGVLKFAACIMDFVKPNKEVVTHAALRFALDSHKLNYEGLSKAVRCMKGNIKANNQKIGEIEEVISQAKLDRNNNVSAARGHIYNQHPDQRKAGCAIAIIREQDALAQVDSCIDRIHTDLRKSLEEAIKKAEPPLSDSEKRQVEEEIAGLDQQHAALKAKLAEPEGIDNAKISRLAFRPKYYVP